ncbi:hypothetical protein SAMN05216343_12245 [Oscillibacter sp. PC13]|jgi:hypothetical protein|uniref:hypothetical protein n=1 Tax=Oscillibacter sp. PC13 TaxID=1855299 RepID=UPI0008E10755|nr:hypothetical protein [Oscillibacter sp. PC13]SFQ06763.1 hypothetical protein SAMN05216343_12245 [Oscillibacter sp. PC13]
MSLKQKQMVSVGIMVAGLFPMILCVLDGNRQQLMWLGMLVFFAGMALNFLLVRCPHCGKWLGQHPSEYCRECGGKIDYQAKK